MTNMARGDFFVFDTRNGSAAMSTRYRVEGDGTATIVAGEMVRQDQGTGDTEYVAIEVDGGSNSTIKIGAAASDSDETTTADGSVWVFDGPSYIFKGRMTTPSNFTAATRLTETTMDVASGTNGRMTIDENDTTNGTYRILDGDATTGMCIFQIALPDTVLGN